MFKKLTSNPFFIFLPFLVYYTYVVIKCKWPSLYGDEIRYVNFANHLVHGFYSPPAPFINLWNGPGYPLILAPFSALHATAMVMTLMNALYLYLAIVFLHKALRLVANYKIATVLSLLLAIYPNALSMLPILYTEAFTYLLVSAFIYVTALFYIKQKKLYGNTAGLILGYLVLTKIIFGYVIILGAGVFFAAYLFKRRSPYLKPLKILLIAFAVAIPYLVYTWHITGKVLYWGNSGGMSLYWMSTPYEQEYGDWKTPNLTNKQYPNLFKASEVAAILKKNHAKDIAYIETHKNTVEQDELYKQIAIENIKQHPLKYLSNCVNNFSRMLFNFPYSYSFQDAGVGRSIIIGSSILWAVIAGSIITFINRRHVPLYIKFMLLLTGLYLLLSDLVSAYPRQLDIILPVLLFWMGFLITNISKPNLKFKDEDELDKISLSGLADSGLYIEDGVTKINKL